MTESNNVGDSVDFINSDFDMNTYAKKKSITQGLLDIALLSSNAAQLKCVLSTAGRHPYYTLLLGLIGVSIILQILQVLICIWTGLVLNINKIENHRKAEITNNLMVMLVALILADNVFISAFSINDSVKIDNS